LASVAQGRRLGAGSHLYPPRFSAGTKRGLAEIVGTKFKQLKPEHNLSQIAEWAENGIYAKDLITLFVVAFSLKCDVDTTFRDLVEKVVRKKAERCTSKAAAAA